MVLLLPVAGFATAEAAAAASPPPLLLAAGSDGPPAAAPFPAASSVGAASAVELPFFSTLSSIVLKLPTEPETVGTHSMKTISTTCPTNHPKR